MRQTSTLFAIVKDERPYLLEWVAYHRLIGFDRIRIYSNDCSDGTDELLDRMQAAGLVEHVRWPSIEGVSAQNSANQDAFRSCDTDWYLPLDADEFLNLAKADSVSEFLDGIPAFASAVAICWRIFGSGGSFGADRSP